MNVPIQIRYHGMDTSDALSAQIHEQAEKLARVYDRIERIEVVVEQPQRRHRHGDRFHIRRAERDPRRLRRSREPGGIGPCIDLTA